VEVAGFGGDEKFGKYILDYRHFWRRYSHGPLRPRQIGYVQGFGGEDSRLMNAFYLGASTLCAASRRAKSDHTIQSMMITPAATRRPTSTSSGFPLAKEMGIKG